MVAKALKGDPTPILRMSVTAVEKFVKELEDENRVLRRSVKKLEEENAALGKEIVRLRTEVKDLHREGEF